MVTRRKGPLFRATSKRVEIWKKRFHLGDSPVRLGRSEIREFAAIGEEFRDAAASDRLDAWLVLLEEAIVYSSYRTVYIFHFLPDDKNEKQKAIALALLIGSLASDLIAIRNIALNGPASAIYAISRMVMERVDVAALLIDKPNLISDFLNQDNSASVKFWKSHVSGGRARRSKLKIIRRLFGDKQAALSARFSADDLDLYSAAVHPSFDMGVANIMGTPAGKDRLFWPAFLRADEDALIRPVIAAVEYAQEFVFLIKAAEEDGWVFLEPSDEKDYVHQRVKGLELLMMALVAERYRMMQDDDYGPNFSPEPQADSEN